MSELKQHSEKLICFITNNKIHSFNELFPGEKQDMKVRTTKTFHLR